MIYQELSLAPHLTRDGEHPARHRADALRPGRSRRACARWRRPRSRSSATTTSRPTSPVGTLSVAAQQLVEIARALAVGCRVLVLDEPTSSLGRDDVRAPVRAAPPAEGAGARDRLHLALHRGGEDDHRSLRRSCATAGTPAAAPRADATHDAIVRLMVGTAPGDLFPRTPRRTGRRDRRGRRPRAGLRVVLAAPRRDSRHRRARRLRAHAAAAHAVRPRSRSKRGRLRIGVYSGGALSAGRAAAGAPGMGLLSEDRKSEGLALGLSIADNLTLTRLEPFGPRRWSCPPGRSRRRATGSRGSRSSARARRSRPASCRAATSRRSRSRACCTTTSTSSCSTSRRAASTSAARRRSTG